MSKLWHSIRGLGFSDRSTWWSERDASGGRVGFQAEEGLANAWRPHGVACSGHVHPSLQQWSIEISSKQKRTPKIEEQEKAGQASDAPHGDAGTASVATLEAPARSRGSEWPPGRDPTRAPLMADRKQDESRQTRYQRDWRRFSNSFLGQTLNLECKRG